MGTGNHGGWKGQLQALLDRHNGYHASRAKTIAHSTRAARAEGLFRSFALLRALGYKVAPANLGGRHVRALMAYWTAAPTLPALLARTGSALAPRAHPYSAAYIQQQLSFLRVFAGWIGKPGMVLPATAYAAPALVRRRLCAARDRSWDSQAVAPDAVLAAVAARDPFVGVQLEVMLAFGLRRKEAVMFAPHLAEVPAHALPAALEPGPYLAFLRVKRGTKGGRLRYTAIRNEAQRAALAKAQQLARAYGGGHIGRPGLTLKQALQRFSDVLRGCGVSRRALGVTPHGLRHQFAADLYYELAEVAPPVRGGLADAGTMNAAYLEVARQLGHGRPQIAGAYLGTRAAPGDAPG